MAADFLLKNVTKEELGGAVEENMYAMFNSMTQVLNGEQEEKPQPRPSSFGGPLPLHSRETSGNDWWHMVFPCSRKMLRQWWPKSIH